MSFNKSFWLVILSMGFVLSLSGALADVHTGTPGIVRRPLAPESPIDRLSPEQLKELRQLYEAHHDPLGSESALSEILSQIKESEGFVSALVKQIPKELPKALETTRELQEALQGAKVGLQSLQKARERIWTASDAKLEKEIGELIKALVGFGGAPHCPAR